MKGSFRIALLATTVVIAKCFARSPISGNLYADQPLCIHLYNLAHASIRTTDRATAQATGIFTKIGIETRWQQPPLDSPEAHMLDFFAGSSSVPRACLVVRIVRGTPPQNFPGALGFALPFARAGVNVEVLYDRLQSQAESAGIPEYTALAYVIAHEIGHVLLGSSAHTRAGVMSTNWDPGTWRLASLGLLAFLPEQGKVLREGLQRFYRQDKKPAIERNSESAQ